MALNVSAKTWDFSQNSSESIIRFVLDSISDAAILIDENGRIISLNPPAEKLFDDRYEDLTDKNILSLIDENYRSEFESKRKNADDKGFGNEFRKSFTVKYYRRDESRFSAETSLKSYQSDGCRLTMLFLRNDDEFNKPPQNEEREKLLTDFIPQQVWTATPEGFINYGNCRTLEFFGKETFAALSKTGWGRIVHPDDLAQTLTRWANALESGENYENEYRILCTDGEYRRHLAQARPRRDEAGRILEWYGTHTDIEELPSVKAHLDSYLNLFRYANDAVLIFDAEAEDILEVNEKACKLYGYPREELLKEKIGGVFPEIKYQDIDNNHLPEELNKSFETIQYRRDGTSLEVFVSFFIIDYRGRKAILSINRDMTESNRTNRLLVHNALHDPLTKLPNRIFFTEHLNHAIERRNRHSETTFAVLFLSSDRFKAINEGLGHTEGDNFITKVAERLRTVMRPPDIVARFGDDEFAVLLNDLGDANDAWHIAERIHERLNVPFNFNGHEFFASVSIGIALDSPQYKNPEDIMRDANIAMRQAGNKGRGRTRVFNQVMQEKAAKSLQLESEMRHSLEKQEFRVYYQPIYNLKYNKLEGFEALARWEHPTLGLISPIEFIPLAEETGLIVPIGEWVLYESCRQFREWQNKKVFDADLTISINLSYKQFLQPNLVGSVARVLQETNLEARYLKLEITESHLMEESERAIDIIKRLRELGIKFSLDDFGTGYSSLSYLHRIPLDYLKIDRSFVSRMQFGSEELEIVKTIISLAKNLGLKTIAEGIEETEQAKLLTALDCNYGQGFLYSKPLPAADVSFNRPTLF